MTRLTWVFFFLLTACGPEVTVLDGGGDAGTGTNDAGMRDSGAPFDAGPDPFDAGPLSDAGPPSDAGVDSGRRDAGPPGPTDRVDLLFMIDNSNSMTEEQASLSAEIPELIRILTSGDIGGDGVPDFEPIEDINVGVVSSDMGTAGHIVPTCANSNFGDDGILQTDGNTTITGCMVSYPAILNYSATGTVTPAEFAADVQCVATMGIGGCGFEQQLEAVLKALTPVAANTTVSADFIPIGTAAAPDGLDRPFYLGSMPHGDRENAGFARPDSVLALIPVTDEEDCSAHDGDLFDPTGGPYSGVDLNLRCFSFPDAQHPIERFIHGFRQLRPSPGRLVYAPIVGIPLDLAPLPGGSPDYDVLVSPDLAVRDDRMEPQIDTTMMNRLVPSCNVVGRGVAYPPVRIVQVAQGLETSGAQVTVQSICQADFRGVLLEVVRRIYLAMAATP